MSTATRSPDAANNPVPFALSFDNAENLVAVKASNSSLSTYRINVDSSLTTLGSVSDGAHALRWTSMAKRYLFDDNEGSASVSSFSEGVASAPVLLNATAATAHTGTTDSTVSLDGDFLYVESGGTDTIDVFSVGTTGSPTPLETLSNLPVSSTKGAARWPNW